MSEDTDYYYRRAEAQIELAEQSDHPAAVAAHVAIAEHYLALCGDELIEEARAATDGLRPVGEELQ